MKDFKWFIVLGACALVWVGLPLAATTAPPPNDTRANAQALEIPAQVTGTTIGATAEASDPQCQPKVRETVWYRFSRTTAGPILVSLQSGGELDAVAAVYQVDKDKLKLLRCEATDAKGHTLFSFESNPKPKTTIAYLLVVGQRLTSDPGAFTLAVSSPARPGNDERPGAVELGTLPATGQGTTIGATTDAGDPDCGNGGPTVWYRLDRAQKSRISVRLLARGNLEGTVCAVLKVRSELRDVGADDTDDRGNATFDFDGSAHATYYLIVAQDPKSEPGAFELAVSSPKRPANDERATAARIGATPSTTRGTTVGATGDDGDPVCAADGPSVWYRLYWGKESRVVVRLHAGGDLGARVCVATPVREKVRKPGQQLRAVTDEATDKRGDAAFDFEGSAGTTYYVIVSQLTPITPGPFSLTILKPDATPVPPGEPFTAGGGKGHLDPLLNPEDAWAVPLQKGATYRITVITRPSECVSVAVYSPRTKSFEEKAPSMDVGCAGTEFFTPGPDGGGIHPVLVSSKDLVTYRLFFRRVQPDDTGPGVLLASGERMTGAVSAADPLDLYRFDVATRSNVQIEVTARRDLDIRLKSSEGRTIRHGERNVKMVRVLDTGTYYVSVSPNERTARYVIRVLVRYVTTTKIAVNGTSSVKVKPGAAVSLQTTTDPSPGPGVTRVQADFFDVATEKWVFRQLWDVAPGSAISFTLGAVGRWRVRATFNGNKVASRSRSGYSTIIVSNV